MFNEEPRFQKLTIIVEGGVKDTRTVYPRVEDLNFDVSYRTESLIGNGLPDYSITTYVDKAQYSFTPVPDSNGVVYRQYTKEAEAWEALDEFPEGPDYKALLNDILNAHKKGGNFSISKEMADALLKAITATEG